MQKESVIRVIKIENEPITIIGIPSGDHECFCFDVPKDVFLQIEGEEPEWVDESCFYKNLFRLYGVPNVPIYEKFQNSEYLLKVTFNEYGVISIEETNILKEEIN